MTEIATIDWFERWGMSVFSENTAILYFLISWNLVFRSTYWKRIPFMSSALLKKQFTVCWHDNVPSA